MKFSPVPVFLKKSFLTTVRNLRRRNSDRLLITHTTSSLFLPNANGEAERAMQTAKRLLRQGDPWLALLINRNTIISATGRSPTQLLVSRHVKTNLPTPPSVLRSCHSSPEDIRENDNKAKLSYARHYDNNNKPRLGLQLVISIQPGDGQWTHGNEPHQTRIKREKN